MSTVSIQLKHTQVSPTSIGTRQCITTKQQVFATYSFNWFILDNFVLGQIGQCGYQIDAEFWSQSTAGLYRGARPGDFTGVFGGRLDR